MRELANEHNTPKLLKCVPVNVIMYWPPLKWKRKKIREIKGDYYPHPYMLHLKAT